MEQPVRGRRRSTALLLSALLVLSVAATAVAVTQQAGADDDAPVRTPLAWFYRPPVEASTDQLAAASSRYILTRLDEPLREELRARGEAGPFLQYLRVEAIMDDTGLGYTWQNQVAYRDGDWARISREHPDWFLLDEDGERIRADDDANDRFYLMDPAHPGWRDFFVSRMAQVQGEGWDGVFLDNVEASLSKRERVGAIPVKYPTDAAWAAAVEDFLQHLRTSYFVPEGRPLEANVVAVPVDGGEAWARLVRHLDGVLREDWLDPTADWEERLREAELAQARGLDVVLVANGEQDDEVEQEFALASFLLVDGGRASFRYTSYDTYDQLWLYDSYRLDLGPPTSARRRVAEGWRRDFARGSVLVDPEGRKARIDVYG